MPISVINIDISKYIKHINIKYTSLKYFRMIFPTVEKQLQKKSLRTATAMATFKFINYDRKNYLTIFADKGLHTLWFLLIIPLPHTY